MRILLIHPAVDFSTTDVADGIRSGLIALGHEVADFRLNRRLHASEVAHDALFGAAGPANVGEMFLHASEGIPYRAIMERAEWALFVHGAGLHPAPLMALRRIGVRVAGVFTEAPYESVADRELGFCQYVDVAFVNERTALGTFQAALDRSGGGVAAYLPHAHRPEVHHADLVCSSEDRCDVLFVGTGFPERQELFEQVDWTGVDLRLGGVWPWLDASNGLHRYLRSGGVKNADLARLYRGARIVLNPHRYAAGAESANPRVYEAAACGAFQIADYRAEIAEVFGDAVPMYTPGVPWQLGALVRRYLADDDLRQRCAETARRRVHGETFVERARLIADVLHQASQPATAAA